MRIPLLLAVLALSACGNDLGVGNAQDCIAKYATTAGSDLGVKAAYRQCRALFSDNPSPAEIAEATCVLPKLADAKTDQGARAVVYICNQPDSSAKTPSPHPADEYFLQQFTASFMSSCTNNPADDPDKLPPWLINQMCSCTVNRVKAGNSVAKLRGMDADTKASETVVAPVMEKCVAEALQSPRGQAYLEEAAKQQVAQAAPAAVPAGFSAPDVVSSGSAIEIVITAQPIGLTSVINAKLTYQDGQTAGNQSATISKGMDTTVITFRNERPWPAGKYLVTVTLDGVLIASERLLEVR